MRTHDAATVSTNEVCNGEEPVVDTWLYTRGASRGWGHELIACSRPEPGQDPSLTLGRFELDCCLRLWAQQRERNLPLNEVILHGGLLTVRATARHLEDIDEFMDRVQVHPCLLEDESAVEVVSWTATLDTTVLDEEQTSTADADQALCTTLRLDASVEVDNPAHRLLDHLDPDTADLALAARIARLGSLGAIQVSWGMGASASLAVLRLLGDQFAHHTAPQVIAQARDIARRWARLLWPPDEADFDRDLHEPSLALAHHLEAASLALLLYPRVSNPVLNMATMTAMWLLSDGRWASHVGPADAINPLIDELNTLPPSAWESVAAAVWEQPATDDLQADLALAGQLGSGARAPSPSDLLVAIPTTLPTATRQRIASAAADLALCRLMGTLRSDPLATILTARSLFE